MADLVEKLDELADLKIEYWHRKKQFDSENKAITDRIKELQSELQTELVALEQSVRTDKLIVTYYKGKVVWNDNFLTGYAFSHPEILQAKKIGEPYVSFRLSDYKNI